MLDLMFEILLIKSIGMTLIVIVLLIARPLVLRKLNAKVAYGLWLMLPIYLILPINFIDATPMNGFVPSIIGTDTISVNLPEISSTVVNHLTDWVIGIWMLGCLFSLGIILTRYHQLKGSLSSLSESQKKVLQTNHLMGDMENIQLVSSQLVDIPAVFGFINSYLIIPSNFLTLSTDSQSMIIQHELYHLKRHDHKANIVRALIKSLFWFNPIFYWADRYCEADQEISCDLGVINECNLASREAYANAMLESITGLNSNRLVSHWNYQILIKERFKMLNNTSTKKWHSWIAATFAVGLVWITSGVVMADKIMAEKGADNTIDVFPTNISALPKYPAKAVEDNIGGWVRFQFNIEDDGHAGNIKVIGSEPEGIFDRAAQNALEQWLFSTDGHRDNVAYTVVFKSDKDLELGREVLPGEKVKGRVYFAKGKNGRLIK